MLAAMENGTYDDPSKAKPKAYSLTVEQLFEAWLLYQRKRMHLKHGGISQNTYNGCKFTAKKTVKFLGASTYVSQLKAKDFENLQHHLLNNYSPTTCKPDITWIRHCFKWASDEEDLEQDLENLDLDKIYKKQFRRPSADDIEAHMDDLDDEHGAKFFTAAEIRLLILALQGKEVYTLVDKKEGPTIELKPNPRMLAMVFLGVNSGLYQGDISALPQSKVDLEKGWHTVKREKTRVKRRSPLWPETIQALKD